MGIFDYCRPEDEGIFFVDIRACPLISYKGHGVHSPIIGGKVVSDTLLSNDYTTGATWQWARFQNSYPKDLRDMLNGEWVQMGSENEA